MDAAAAPPPRRADSMDPVAALGEPRSPATAAAAGAATVTRAVAAAYGAWGVKTGSGASLGLEVGSGAPCMSAEARAIAVTLLFARVLVAVKVANVPSPVVRLLFSQHSGNNAAGYRGLASAPSISAHYVPARCEWGGGAVCASCAAMPFVAPA